MTVEQILKRAEKPKEVTWGAKTVQDAMAAREELVPKLLEHLNWYYEQIQKPGWWPTAEMYYLNLNGYRLLAEMKETRVYPLLLKVLNLPNTLLCEGFFHIHHFVIYMADILHGTYDGNLAETEAMVANTEAGENARFVLLKMMGMLCKDGRISREEMIRFTHDVLAREQQLDNLGFVSGIPDILEPLHLHELCMDMRELVRKGLLYEWDYADAIDHIFQYDGGPREEWVGTDSKGNPLVDGPTPLERILVLYDCSRNEPCLCGSGKKFQDCCMQRQKKLRKQYPDFRLEDEEQVWYELEPIIYPPVENVGDNPGLAVYFSREAIAVDEHVYRAKKILAERVDGYQYTEVEIEIGTAELCQAFEGFEKICRENGYQTLSAYDQTHMVHYTSEGWLVLLENQLQKTGDSRLTAVEKWLATAEHDG